MLLTPGVRLVDRPGALYFVDGRRVVAIQADDHTRRAIRAAIDPGRDGSPALDEAVAADIDDLLERLQLGTAERPAADAGGRRQPDRTDQAECAAQFASAAVGGWVAPHDASDRLLSTTVHVHEDESGSLRALLRASGLTCRALGGPADVARLDPRHDLVAVVATPQQPATALGEMNEACLAGRVPWLPISGYDGALMHVGPLMIPGQTACFECLLRRLAANVEYADVFRDVVADAPPAPTPRALRDWSYSIAALVLLRWVANRDNGLPGRLLTLAVDEFAIRPATVFRVPRCAACSAPDFTTAAAPWGVARDH